MSLRISVPRDALAAFCRVHGIMRLSSFGSVLREDFGAESDIDVLVELKPDRIPGPLGVACMALGLSELFSGRKVDLRTPEELRRDFRQDVLDTAVVQYVEG